MNSMLSPRIILASASLTRQRMLASAGLNVIFRPAAIDEDAIREALAKDGATVADAAIALAELKANRVSQQEPDALVIGADQILDCEGKWFAKAVDMADAVTTLKALAGRPHRLTSAVAVFRNGQRLWSQAEQAMLTMRSLSDAEISRYLDLVGLEILISVGCYQVETIGICLFEDIIGEHSTILGLPMLPLLRFLRLHGVSAP